MIIMLNLQGESWHTDNSYMTAPSFGSILVGREVPSVGNDTLFANMGAVYDSLSPALRAVLDPLKAVHSASAAFNPSTVKVCDLIIIVLFLYICD